MCLAASDLRAEKSRLVIYDDRINGFDKTFLPGVADIGTNLLLAWALQIAERGDFYSRSTQWRISIASGLVNLVYVV